MYRAQMCMFSTICRRRSKTAKQKGINQNDHLYTVRNTTFFKICMLYMQIWTAWIRTTWPVPERFRSTIRRRRSKIAKQMEINKNNHLYTSKHTKILKYVCCISTFEQPELAQLDPSRNASEARFVGVTETLQNTWKSTKTSIIYIQKHQTLPNMTAL